MTFSNKNICHFILLKLRTKYRYLFYVLVLENCNGYNRKKVSNFENYRQNLSNFDENLPKIGILSPGITTLNSGNDS